MSRSHPLLRFVGLPLCPLVVWLAGCGGDDASEVTTTKPPPRQTAQPQKVEPKTIQPHKATAAPVAKKAGSLGGKKPGSAPVLPPGVSPEDLFHEGADDHAWTIAATHEERSSLTLVAAPSEGSNAHTFLHPDRSNGNDTRRRSVIPSNRRVIGATGRSDLPSGFKPAPGTDKTEDGLPLRIVNEADESEMVLIPEGTFLRGSRNGPDNTRPRHTAFLDAYYISLHEVTLRQFLKFAEAVEKERRRPLDGPVNEDAPLDHPALGVPFKEVEDYVAWAKVSLPTEAQWEKAARGPDGATYAWGNGRPVWQRKRDRGEITEVMFWPNDVSFYGLYDMAGNAREWCRDLYFEEAYSESGEQGQLLLKNPVNETMRRRINDRVIRGGGDDWRVWYREHGPLTAQIPDVGFRYVLNFVKPEAESAGDSSETRGPRRSR